LKIHWKLVCVSGGSDSMALMHSLARIRDRKLLNMSIEVINFNHKKRIEADEEVASFLFGFIFDNI